MPCAHNSVPKRDPRLLIGAIVSGALLWMLAGCAAQTGLLSPGVERVTLSTVNVVRGPREVVSARCVQGKQAWDDGSPYDPTDTSKWARCCTVYRKSRRKPFTIWITEGEEECFVHELCHVEQFLSPRTDHSKCHDFGLGKPKKRL